MSGLWQAAFRSGRCDETLRAVNSVLSLCAPTGSGLFQLPSPVVLEKQDPFQGEAALG